MESQLELLRKTIRTIEDFPKPGISFKDISPLFSDAECLNAMLDILFEKYKDAGITKVCGIESRGFLLGCALAAKLNAGFVPIRKAGKLPFTTRKQDYELEYGTDTIEIHTDAIEQNDVVLIHDDLLATGGTMKAAVDLVDSFQPKNIEISFIIELCDLNGRNKISETKGNIDSLISY